MLGLHLVSRSAAEHSECSQTVEGLEHQWNPISLGHNDWLVLNQVTQVSPVKVTRRSFTIQTGCLRFFLESMSSVILLQKVLRGDHMPGALVDTGDAEVSDILTVFGGS